MKLFKENDARGNKNRNTGQAYICKGVDKKRKGLDMKCM